MKVLTDYGIETFRLFCLCNEDLCEDVATAPTACGIETVEYLLRIDVFFR